jgi:putative transposase
MTMAPKTPSPFSDEVLDQILANYTKPEDLTGKHGILKQLTARLVERALQSEISEHLGYEKHDPKGRGTPNSRNRTSPKTLKTTDLGEVDIEVARDREGSFEPQLVRKHQSRFTGFDTKIPSFSWTTPTLRRPRMDAHGRMPASYTGIQSDRPEHHDVACADQKRIRAPRIEQPHLRPPDQPPPARAIHRIHPRLPPPDPH